LRQEDHKSESLLRERKRERERERERQRRKKGRKEGREEDYERYPPQSTRKFVLLCTNYP
jgi:hypothetical protein